MNFAVENPYWFFALLILVPALAFLFYRYRNLLSAFTDRNRVHNIDGQLRKLKSRFLLRTVFRVLAFVMIIFALSGFSWGTKTVPVQKSGKAVSLVFDISYSMEAKDCYNGKSRLDEARDFASVLLSRLDGVSTSVVLAKGNGTVAVPLTEDREAVNLLLANLSPKLMTAEGSSLGSGIMAAINSFPSQTSETSFIWLFTDGEETDESLSQALSQCIKYGIPVGIVGFGNTARETEIMSGDGVTKVNTALREENIKKCIETAFKKNPLSRNNVSYPSVLYVNYSENGSAYKMLKLLNIDASGNISSSETTNIAFEVQSVNRQHVFISLAIVFFLLSVFAGEFDLRIKKLNVAKATATMLCLSVFLTGCSDKFNDGKKILEGRLEWNRKNYSNAVADFLQAVESASLRNDSEFEDYALYGLASTYLMQNESDAAVERYGQISDEAPDSVKFAVLYNSGIIAHRNGDYDTAAEFFKSALLINSQSVNAKINLELSLQGETVQSSAQEQQMDKVNANNEESDFENAIYSLIRENEDNQWKNKQQESESSIIDY